MNKIYLLVALVFAFGFVLAILKARFPEGQEKPKYQYLRKQFFMTRAEHHFYKTLVEAVGQEYFVFAQVHLPTILDHTIRGQGWRAALAHINRKSLDFVLCDKTYISPKLAIEFDDRSHERPERQERDRVVEGILEHAGMPLLRLKNHGDLSAQELSEEIRKALNL